MLNKHPTLVDRYQIMYSMYNLYSFIQTISHIQSKNKSIQYQGNDKRYFFI
jgi:hypothetical protein